MAEAKKTVHSRAVVGRNAVVQMIAVIFSRAVGLVFNMVIARQLGEEALGGFRFSLTYVAYFQVFAAMGLTLLTVRELAAKPEKASSIFFDTILLRTVAAILSLLIIVTSLPLLSYSATVNLLILTLSSTVLTYGLRDSAQAAFTAFQRMELHLYVTVLGGVSYFLFGVIGFMAGLGTEGIAIAVALSNVLTSIFGLFLVHHCVFPLKIVIDRARLRRWTKLMLPFFLLSVAANLSEKVDMFLLSRLTTFQVIGWYSAAYLFLDVAKMIPASFISAAFPALASRRTVSPDRFYSAADTAVRGVLVITGMFPAIVIPLAPFVIEAVFGPGFGPSVSVLQLLMISLVFYGLNYIFTSAILVTEGQRPLILISLLMLLANVVLNLWLVPMWSHMGAGIAKVVSFGIGTILHSMLLRNRKVQVLLLPSLTRTLTCVLLTGLAVAVLSRVIGLLAMPIGMLVYGLLACFLGAIKNTEVSIALHLLCSVFSVRDAKMSRRSTDRQG